LIIFLIYEVEDKFDFGFLNEKKNVFSNYEKYDIIF